MNNKTRSFSNFKNKNFSFYLKLRKSSLISNKNFEFISNFEENKSKNRFGRELRNRNLNILCFALNSSNSYIKKEKKLNQNIGNLNFKTQTSNTQTLQEKTGSLNNLNSFNKNKKITSSKANFNVAYSKVSEVKLITIGLASPLRIRQWAERTLPNGKRVGEVLNANTLHHKTFKPQKGGLFCERIFGPLKDFTCACGKVDKSLKKSWSSRTSEINKTKSTTEGSENKVNKKTSQLPTTLVSDKPIQKNFAPHYCPDCDVEYTWSVVRRYQLGYIKLNSPVTHVWYLKSTPSYLSILLDIKKRNLINTTYCSEILTIERSSKKILKLLDTESPNELFKKWQIIMNKKSNQQTNQSSLNNNSQYNLGPIYTNQNLSFKTKRSKVNFVKQNLNFLQLIKVVAVPKTNLKFDLDMSNNSAFLSNKKENSKTDSLIAEQKFAEQFFVLKNSVRKENFNLFQFAPLKQSSWSFLQEKTAPSIFGKEKLKLINKSNTINNKYNCKILLSKILRTLILFICKFLLRNYFVRLNLIELNSNKKINLVNNQLFDSVHLNRTLDFTKNIRQNQKSNLISQSLTDSKKLNSGNLNYEKQNFIEKSLLNLTNVNLLNNNFKLNNQNSTQLFVKENSNTKQNFSFRKKAKNLPISFYIVLKEEKNLQKQVSLLTAIEQNWVSICQKAYLKAVFKINSIFSKNSVLTAYQNLSSTNNVGLISLQIKENFLNNILSEKFSVASANFSKKLKSLFELVKNSYKKHIKYLLKNVNKSNLYLNYITTGELTNRQKMEQFINTILNNQNSKFSNSTKNSEVKICLVKSSKEDFTKQKICSANFYSANFYSANFCSAFNVEQIFEENTLSSLSSLTKKQTTMFINLLTDMFVEQLLLSKYFVKKEDNFYSVANQLITERINFSVISNLTQTTPQIFGLNSSKNKFSEGKIFYYSKLFFVNRGLKQQNLDKLNTQVNSVFANFNKKNNIFFTTSYNKISSAYLNFKFAPLQKTRTIKTQNLNPELVSNFLLKEFGSSCSLLNSVNMSVKFCLAKFYTKKLQVLATQKKFNFSDSFSLNLQNKYLYNKVLLLKNSLDFNNSLISNSWSTLDNLSLRHLTTIFNTYNLNNKLSTEKEKNTEFVPNLVNNCYSLSHRETWEGDKDWQIFAIYSSNLPSYAVFNNSQNNLDFENLDLFSHDRTIPAYNYRFVNSGEQVFGEFNLIENSKSNVLNASQFPRFRNKFTQETKTSANFSGPGIVNLLLEEFSFSSLKKLDKQNRILLYQLNKYISFYKKNLKLWESKKKKTSILKLLRDFTKKRDFLIRRTKLVRKLFRKETDPRSMILTLLPVLPPDLRPIVKMGTQIAASDLNRLYQRVIYRNDRLKKFLKDSSISNSYSMKYAQRLLQEAVDNLIQNGKSGVVSEKDSRGRLLKSLSDILKGKQGRFRQYLLGKRVDYSGRSVIVVGPKLKIHECGIPKEMALELYLPFLLKAILVRKKARTVIGAKTFIQTNPTFTWELLREIMQLTPVLLNRAPTLHRLGIQAFQPRLVEGRAILLHPLVCPAFNADFDGDQMAVHVPITVEARAEAWKLMLARNNFLSPATGEPLAIPSQDMVLGCYYLTTYGNKWAIKHQRGSGFYFTNLMDVIKAYNQQRLDIHALIWVKWDVNNGQVESGTEREEPREIRISQFGNWQEIKPKTYNTYSATNNLNSQYICTTPGRILFNMVLQKFV